MYNRLSDMDLEGKKVIVRAGFDVPLDEKGNITDDKRIKAVLPTINILLEKKAKVIIISHNGRPDGKIVENLNMDSCAKRLGELLSKEVKKLDECIGEKVKEETNLMKEGEIIVLENLRFHKEEKDDDDDFAKELASLGDYYVNEAFPVSHRKQASITGIPKYIPGIAGMQLEKEIDIIKGLIENPEKPYVAILGGAKVSDKVELIKAQLENVDNLLLGGAMIFTFFKAQGKEIGKSLCEDDKIELARELLKDEKLVLPEDVIVGDKFSDSSYANNVNVDDIKNNEIGLDIGERSIERYKEILKDAKTIVWNGPLGKFEEERFAKATDEIASFVSGLDAKVVIGGGDSALAIEQSGHADQITHISTGGGAFMKFLEKKTLVGIEALEESYEKFKQE